MLGLSIDPGLETGVCLFSWSEEQPIIVEGVYQFPHGAAGLAAFLDKEQIRVVNPGPEGFMKIRGHRLDVLVVERFTPRPNEMFSHTRKSVESLRGEGALISRYFEPFIEWAEPSQQYFMGNSGFTLPQKKSLSRGFLKAQDMHVTGGDVGRPNADDAISATLHAVAYLRRKKHRPTLVELFGPEEVES